MRVHDAQLSAIADVSQIANKLMDDRRIKRSEHSRPFFIQREERLVEHE